MDLRSPVLRLPTWMPRSMEDMLMNTPALMLAAVLVASEVLPLAPAYARELGAASGVELVLVSGTVWRLG